MPLPPSVAKSLRALSLALRVGAKARSASVFARSLGTWLGRSEPSPHPLAPYSHRSNFTPQECSAFRKTPSHLPAGRLATCDLVRVSWYPHKVKPASHSHRRMTESERQHDGRRTTALQNKRTALQNKTRRPQGSTGSNQKRQRRRGAASVFCFSVCLLFLRLVIGLECVRTDMAKWHEDAHTRWNAYTSTSRPVNRYTTPETNQVPRLSRGP